MNKIKVKESNLTDISGILKEVVDDKLIITFQESIDIEIDFEHKYSEYIINIEDNVNVSIYEFIENKTSNYIYNINKNASLNITKFYHNIIVDNTDIINLNEENAKVNYNLKTIANEAQNFNLYVNHNALNTISDIKNNGVNIDGHINFMIESKVPNGIKNCTANQSSRIVTFNENKCTIKPNLLIDETDVIANHSALIGKFEDDEIFYLESRGIDYTMALKMLVKGFLKIDDPKVDKLLDRYWR